MNARLEIGTNWHFPSQTTTLRPLYGKEKVRGAFVARFAFARKILHSDPTPSAHTCAQRSFNLCSPAARWEYRMFHPRSPAAHSPRSARQPGDNTTATQLIHRSAAVNFCAGRRERCSAESICTGGAGGRNVSK